MHKWRYLLRSLEKLIEFPELQYDIQTNIVLLISQLLCYLNIDVHKCGVECDGTMDCDDGEDEQNCGCADPTPFTCPTGGIPLNKII